ncbi:DUF2721 domain-containing protein [Alsobacter sp. SYSU M60028]|uniref:DUF2721 domain-containing protein n=1 Tax=Alsobacter ponti TaxID=2962936 RepID=A0ABT1L6T7_9HYPH|nr:DUF2721 domain-containing protein [Alsobacter ponti]MCP8937141.1 DUF2721 domain-containing protein [Alsobacter ponti]
MFVPDVARLASIFSQATAPAFFLGAVAAFVSLMSGRLNVVVARIQKLNRLGEDHPKHEDLKADLARLRRRARLLSNAISAALVAGVCSTLLLAELFVTEFLGFHHAYGGALLFTFATLALGWGLVLFFQETRVGLAEADEYE